MVSAENRLSGQSNSAGEGEVARPWGQSQKAAVGWRRQSLGLLLPFTVSTLPTLAPNLTETSSTELWESTRLGEGRSGVSFHPAARLFAPLYSNPFPDVEWMPIHTRAYVGTLIGYVYSLGQFILAGVAYAVPHWRHLQLLVSVPFFAAFIYSWYVGSGVGSNGQKPTG